MSQSRRVFFSLAGRLHQQTPDHGHQTAILQADRRRRVVLRKRDARRAFLERVLHPAFLGVNLHINAKDMQYNVSYALHLRCAHVLCMAGFLGRRSRVQKLGVNSWVRVT